MPRRFRLCLFTLGIAIELCPDLHSDDFTPIDGGPRRGYSILGGLLGGPMLHFVPTTSPGRPSKSSSMEIWRYYATGLSPAMTVLMHSPTLPTPASDGHGLGQSASCPQHV
jgi:hypothetical protein